MAEDVAVSEETLTSALTKLVNLSKGILQKVKQEAKEGRTNRRRTHFLRANQVTSNTT